MGDVVHTFVDFHGDFPLPHSFPDISASEDSIPGRELAEYLAAELRLQDFAVTDPEPEDYEHLVRWKGARQEWLLHVGVDSFGEEMDRWTIIAGRTQLGFFQRSVRSSDLDELACLLGALDQALKQSPQICDVRWFPSYEPPGELERQPYYACPTSKQPAWRPETTQVYRLIALHQRVCDRCAPWCPRVVVGGIVAYVVLVICGLPNLAPTGIMAAVLVVTAVFTAVGTRFWLDGTDMAQQRLKAGKPALACVGFALLFLLGAFFVWGGLAGAWAFFLHWPG